MEFLDISSIEGSQASMYNSIDHGREILILTIDIGCGKTDEIIIREHDTPKFIAKEFCRKHKLNPEAEKVLIDLIKSHIYVKPTVEVSMMEEQPSKTEEILKQNTSFKLKDESKPKSDKSTSENDPLKNSKSSHKTNIGERLYAMGLMSKEKHEKKISEMREKISKDQMKGITFKPSITPERKMPRLQLLSSETTQKTMDRCLLLYNKSQKSTSTSHSPAKFIQNASNFSQKVLNSRKNLQHYLEQREQMERKVGRSKSPSMMSRERMKKNCRSQSHDLKVKLSNEQTDKIINRIKTIRFIQLFELLNPDENQEISKNTVVLARMPKIIVKVLLPFLEELQRLPGGLNLEQFCKVMELYVKDLTPEERSILLQTGKRKSSPGVNRNIGASKDTVTDLWSPKHEEKLLAFDHFPEFIEKD